MQVLMNVSESFMSSLIRSANHLSDKDAKAFAEALKENRTLTHLDLSHNEIGEMGGIYLGAGLVRSLINKDQNQNSQCSLSRFTFYLYFENLKEFYCI